MPPSSSFGYLQNANATVENISHHARGLHYPSRVSYAPFTWIKKSSPGADEKGGFLPSICDSSDTFRPEMKDESASMLFYFFLP